MPDNKYSKTSIPAIYYVCAVDISNYDAQRTHILEVLSSWQKKGLDVTLFLPQFSEKPEFFEFTHIQLPVCLRKSKLKFVEYEIRLGVRLFSIIKKKKPRVIYIRKGFLTFLPAFLSKFFKIKCVVEANGFVGDEVRFGFGLPLFITRMFIYSERLTCRLADRIIAVTDGLKKLLSETHNIDPAKIQVISNGVNIERFRPLNLQPEKTIYLGFIGNLVPWSGVEFLVKSLPLVVKRYPRVKCLIVGDGGIRSQLGELAESLIVRDAVIFAGTVPPEQVPQYINRCHICYLPAIRQRNSRIGISPLKLYEYLACGIPVIVTNISGMEIVEMNGVGLVVEPESEEALAQATLKLLENPDLRAEMSRKARRIAEREFSWDKISEKILQVIRL
jgi:glycosyltransferase involved in cell wall biosynthesis